MFQVLVVGGDDAVCLLYAELFQYGLCYCPSNLWLRSCSELINENQGAVVGTLHHVFHVRQMARICTQVIFYALFVTDIYKDILENAGF